MLNPESIPENETHKVHGDFELKNDHPLSARRSVKKEKNKNKKKPKKKTKQNKEKRKSKENLPNYKRYRRGGTQSKTKRK